MSRLIDANALKESIKRQADILRAMGNEVLTEYTDVIQTGFCQEIDNAPTIEPLEIVRCKECKHWYPDADCGMACEFTCMGQPEDGFCNWGQRGEWKADGDQKEG